MQKITGKIVVTTLLCFMLTLPIIININVHGQGPTTLRVDPPEQEIPVESFFDVFVWVDSFFDIYRDGIALAYDTSIIDAVDVESVPPFSTIGKVIDDENGYMLIESVAEPPIHGSIPLAHFTFRCTGGGISDLTIVNYYLFDPYQNPIPVDEIINGRVTQTSWYFKPACPDYAPSGIPDFDQKQDAWTNPTTGQWSYCGPTAIANSFWWLDSFYEPNPIPPPTINDNFPLVWSYNSAQWDDHDPLNVGPLIANLAWYMDTDGQRTGIAHSGTKVIDMARGIDKYLLDHGLIDKFYQKTMKAPDFYFIEKEVKKCEDVVLLLGFWQTDGQNWWRVGGHYVTVAGIDSQGLLIAFSDPFVDNAEAGRQGIVLPGPHGYPHDPTVHNDTLFVSHDIYAAWVPGHGGSPGNPNFEVGYNEYEVDEWYALISNMAGQNTPDEFEQQTGQYNPTLTVFTEVEYAVIVSPWYAKPPAIDYSPCGVPDFDQRQDAWINPITGKWSYCGPVAEASSLWYLDSHYEPNETPPPEISDGFPLVTAYGEWDDHDQRNVQPLIGELAWYMDTDGIRTQIPHSGTYVADMQMGIEMYLSEKGLSYKFYEHTIPAPPIELIDEELRRCQDVVLLLGFWQTDGQNWWRVGGHYVTVVGIDIKDMFIEISDPIQDVAETGGMGSVPIAHTHAPQEPPYETHNNASLVSHDLYQIILDPCPGGPFSLEGYWNESTHINFVGQNFPEQELGYYIPNLPVHTQIDFAVIVSCKTGIVVAGSEDTNLYAWDFFGALQWQQQLGKPVISVAMDNNGTFVAAGTRTSSGIGDLWLFDSLGNLQWLKSNLNVSTSYNGGWAGTESKSVDAKYNAYNGLVVVAAATDQGLYLFDQNGNQIWQFYHQISETLVRISQDGNYIICLGNIDGQVHYFSHMRNGVPGWQTSDGFPVWESPDVHAFWAAISGDGSYITYTGGSWPAPNQLSLVKMKTTPPIQVWQANLPQSAFWRVDMPCHGKSVVVVNDDPSDSVGALAIYWNDGGNGWDAGDSVPVWTYWPDKDIGGAQNPLADFYTVAISENGGYIATGGTPHNTYLLKNDATVQQKIGLMPGSVQSVDLTLSGKYGVAGDNTGNVWFFDKDTGFKWSWTTGGAIHAVAISKVYPCMFPYPDHDVAVTNIKPNKTIVGQGYNANISITVTNEGNFQETFEVTLCANSTVIGTQTVNNLAAGMSIILNFSGNTNSYEKGIYTIWAFSSITPDEIDVYDNHLIDGTIKVTIPGDVDGDFKVKMDDIMLIVGAFGSTLKADGWYWHTPPCTLCPHNPNYDVDGNGKVDMGDIIIACDNFGKTYP